MSELTDYEINKRLAEIAGYDFRETEGAAIAGTDADGTEWVSADAWSPLTDWSQLGPLMERERVRVLPFPSCLREWRAWARIGPGLVPVFADHSDLKRAICLAIVKAHKTDAGEGVT